MSISAIIITRNEEENIEDCIKTLDFSDEIVVVDNNSTDNTVSLAKASGAKIFQISGLDFSYLRNIGKEKATSNWLFYIDADERVTPNLAREIKNLVKTDSKKSAFSVLRKNYFLGSPSPKLERMTRLIKKDSLIGWQGSLHETPMIAGETGNMSSYLLHYTHRDLTSMVNKTNEWSEVEAQLLYKSNHPQMSWWRFFRIMIHAFTKSYIKDTGYKMGEVGIIESIYQAFSSFITYAKLWEKQNKPRPHPIIT